MAETEMVERVAKAIYAANGWWRAVEGDDDGLGRYKYGHGDDRFRAIEWEQLPEEDRREHLDSARAAIEAMREPDATILAAMSRSWLTEGRHDMAHAWRAGISALSDPKEEGNG